MMLQVVVEAQQLQAQQGKTQDQVVQVEQVQQQILQLVQ
tara:strand:+ start:244 stop:360 length:117 start_codon:yes stop_codon:yes gene_type:complete